MKVILPKNKHITYLDYEDDLTIIEDNMITWELTKETPESVTMEYSYISTGVGNVRGSIVFWLSVNIILIVVLFIQIIKEARS